MYLPPIPMVDLQQQFAGELLKKELASSPFEEVVDRHLAAFKDWQSSTDPVRRRFRKNASLIYSQEELRQFIASTMLQVLGAEARKYIHG